MRRPIKQAAQSGYQEVPGTLNERGSGDVATIADVARIAGVSVATVSRVFNRPEIVTEKTRRAVSSAAESLNFHLNRTASGLRSGRHQCISMLMADVSQPWYGGIARAVDKICDKAGFAVKIRSFSHDRARMLAYLDTVASDGVDGIILNTGDELDDPEITAAIERVAASGVSLVLIGQRIKSADSVDTVLYDDEHSAYRAIKHLHEVWGSELWFLGDIAGSAGAADRRLGFDRAVSELGIKSAAKCLDLDGYGAKYGYGAANAFLESHSAPSAVLAVNDQIAVGAFRALRDHGLSAGIDVGVVGFGDVEFAPYLVPSLSSVSGCVEEIAKTALDMLFARINSPGDDKVKSHTVLVKRPLIIRESSSGSLRRV